jgi:hypothetical protein
MGDCERSDKVEVSRYLPESLFLLKKTSSNSTASIQVDFSPLKHASEAEPSVAKTLPTFNVDGNYFTPSFILSIDQVRMFLFSRNIKKIYRFILIFIIEKPLKCLNKK